MGQNPYPEKADSMVTHIGWHTEYTRYFEPIKNGRVCEHTAGKAFVLPEQAALQHEIETKRMIFLQGLQWFDDVFRHQFAEQIDAIYFPAIVIDGFTYGRPH